MEADENSDAPVSDFNKDYRECYKVCVTCMRFDATSKRFALIWPSFISLLQTHDIQVQYGDLICIQCFKSLNELVRFITLAKTSYENFLLFKKSLNLTGARKDSDLILTRYDIDQNAVSEKEENSKLLESVEKDKNCTSGMTNNIIEKNSAVNEIVSKSSDVNKEAQTKTIVTDKPVESEDSWIDCNNKADVNPTFDFGSDESENDADDMHKEHDDVTSDELKQSINSALQYLDEDSIRNEESINNVAMDETLKSKTNAELHCVKIIPNVMSSGNGVNDKNIPLGNNIINDELISPETSLNLETSCNRNNNEEIKDIIKKCPKKTMIKSGDGNTKDLINNTKLTHDKSPSNVNVFIPKDKKIKIVKDEINNVKNSDKLNETSKIPKDFIQKRNDDVQIKDKVFITKKSRNENFDVFSKNITKKNEILIPDKLEKQSQKKYYILPKEKVSVTDNSKRVVNKSSVDLDLTLKKTPENNEKLASDPIEISPPKKKVFYINNKCLISKTSPILSKALTNVQTGNTSAKSVEVIQQNNNTTIQDQIEKKFECKLNVVETSLADKEVEKEDVNKSTSLTMTNKNNKDKKMQLIVNKVVSANNFNPLNSFKVAPMSMEHYRVLRFDKNKRPSHLEDAIKLMGQNDGSKTVRVLGVNPNATVDNLTNKEIFLSQIMKNGGKSILMKSSARGRPTYTIIKRSASRDVVSTAPETLTSSSKTQSSNAKVAPPCVVQSNYNYNLTELTKASGKGIDTERSPSNEQVHFGIPIPPPPLLRFRNLGKHLVNKDRGGTKNDDRINDDTTKLDESNDNSSNDQADERNVTAAGRDTYLISTKGQREHCDSAEVFELIDWSTVRPRIVKIEKESDNMEVDSSQTLSADLNHFYNFYDRNYLEPRDDQDFTYDSDISDIQLRYDSDNSTSEHNYFKTVVKDVNKADAALEQIHEEPELLKEIYFEYVTEEDLQKQAMGKTVQPDCNKRKKKSSHPNKKRPRREFTKSIGMLDYDPKLLLRPIVYLHRIDETPAYINNESITADTTNECSNNENIDKVTEMYKTPEEINSTLDIDNKTLPTTTQPPTEAPKTAEEINAIVSDNVVTNSDSKKINKEKTSSPTKKQHTTDITKSKKEIDSALTDSLRKSHDAKQIMKERTSSPTKKQHKTEMSKSRKEIDPEIIDNLRKSDDAKQVMKEKTSSPTKKQHTTDMTKSRKETDSAVTDNLRKSHDAKQIMKEKMTSPTKKQHTTAMVKLKKYIDPSIIDNAVKSRVKEMNSILSADVKSDGLETTTMTVEEQLTNTSTDLQTKTTECQLEKDTTDTVATARSLLKNIKGFEKRKKEKAFRLKGISGVKKRNKSKDMLTSWIKKFHADKINVEKKQDILNVMASIKEQLDFIKAPYKCEQCARTFGSCRSLQRHSKLYHSKSSGCFECEVCTCRFPSENELRRHTRVHGEYYLCKLCFVVFLTSKELVLHCVQMHEKQISRIQKVREKIEKKSSAGAIPPAAESATLTSPAAESGTTNWKEVESDTSATKDLSSKYENRRLRKSEVRDVECGEKVPEKQ